MLLFPKAINDFACTRRRWQPGCARAGARWVGLRVHLPYHLVTRRVRERHHLVVPDGRLVWPAASVERSCLHQIRVEVKDDRLGAVPLERLLVALAHLVRLHAEKDGSRGNHAVAALRADGIVRRIKGVPALGCPEDLVAAVDARAEQVNPAAIITALRSELGAVDPYDRNITPRVLRVAVEKRLGSGDLSDRKNFIIEAIRAILAEMYTPAPHAAR